MQDHRLTTDLAVLDVHLTTDRPVHSDSRAVRRSTGKEWFRCPSRLLVVATKSVELAPFIVDAQQLQISRRLNPRDEARRSISLKPSGVHDHVGHATIAQKAHGWCVGKRLQAVGRFAVRRWWRTRYTRSGVVANVPSMRIHSPH